MTDSANGDQYNAKRRDQPFKIDEIFVGLSAEPSGPEGIAAMVIPKAGAFPMVGTTPIVLTGMKLQAQAIADRTGEVIRIIRFSRSETIATFYPSKKEQQA